MKLEKNQKQWLVGLGVKDAARVKLEARENLKLAVLTDTFRAREEHGDELSDAMDQKVVKEGTKKTQDMHDKILRDQTKLFDLDEQKQGFVLGTLVTKEVGKKGKTKQEIQPEEWNKLTGEQKNFQKIQKAGRVVDSIARQMQVEVEELDENGDPVMIDVKTPQGTVKKKKMVPLFSPDEMKEELYTPLVRRGMIPETNVPDDFSATKEMVDGSMGAYANRLTREGKKSKFAENLSLGIAVFRGAVSFAGQVQGVVAASNLPNSQLQWTPDTSHGLHGMMQGFGKEQNDAGATEEFATVADKAAQGYIFAQNVSDMAFDLGKEGGEAAVEKYGSVKDQKTKTALEKAAGKVGGVAVAEIASAFGAALNDYGLGMAASSTFGALVPGAKVAKEVREKKIKEAGVLLKNALSAAIMKLDPQQGTSTADFKKAVTAAESAFDKAFKADDVSNALDSQAFEKAASSLAAGGVAAAKAVQEDNKLRILFLDTNNVDLAQNQAGKVACEEFERDDSPKPTKKQIDNHPKDHEAQWLETKEGFKCLKCAGASEDPEQFAGILEAKIKQLETDAALWKWITTIGGMGFDVAADFVAPLAIGGALLRMAKNVNEAMKRYSDFNAFLKDEANMLRAASAYSAPLSQFVDNAGKQFAHYSVNAAMEGMKIIGACLQMGLLTAPVGVGVSAGANISQAVEGVLYEAKKRWDLGTAWETYKKALENPENRKLALKAMKDNPTLAKYAVAWGAVIKKDPLVANFMNHCKLNKDTLKDPEANIDLVVKYLETRMPDDNVVVGRDYSSPNKVQLTAEVWIKEKKKAEKSLKIKVQDTKRLEYLLTQWTTEYPLQKSAKDKDPESVEKCRKILDDIDLEFLKYNTVDANEARVIEALDMKQKFTKQVTVFRQEIQVW